MLRTLPVRIRTKIRVNESGCWIWTAANFGIRGYGAVWWHGQAAGAHRVVYEILCGPIPEGFEIDHLCRVRLCVNPDHLEPVSDRENILRGFGPAARNSRKFHCKNGHRFDADNTHVLASGGRRCRACERSRARARRARARARDLSRLVE